MAVATLDCREGGIATNPFTVTRALAAKAADHEVASDATWSAAAAASIILADAGTAVGANAAGAGASGVTVSGRAVTITATGTSRIGGALSDGEVAVNTTSADPVPLMLDGVSITNADDVAHYVWKAARAVLVLGATRGSSPASATCRSTAARCASSPATTG